MTNTDGQGGGERNITMALETELAQVSQVSIAAAAKVAEDRDIATVMGEVATTMIAANFRLRRSLKFTGDDAHWWLATVDYLTRPTERQPSQPATGTRQKQN